MKKLLIICAFLNCLQHSELLANDPLTVEELILLSDETLYSNADSAKLYARAALILSLEENSKNGEASAYQRLGKALQGQGFYDSAIYFSEKALNIWTALKIPLEIANIKNNIGIIYDEKGIDDEATKYYISALKIYEGLNDKFGIAKVYNNLGIINKKNKKFEQVLYYYQKALEIYENQEFNFGIAATKGNIGSVYLELENYHQSIEFSKEAINSFITNNINQFLPYSYENLGLAYGKIGELSESEKYHQLALNGYLEYGNQKESAFTLTSLAKIAIQKEQFNKAIAYGERSLKIAKKISAIQEIILAYEVLFISQCHMKDPHKAMGYFEFYKFYTDSVNQKQRNKVIEETQAKYETEKKEKEISLLTAQNEIQSLEIQNNQVMLGGMGGIAILLVVSTIALYSRKNYKLKVNLAEEKEAQQKLRFKSVIEGEEKERKRIAQDLHDGLGQLLSTARLNVSVLEDEILDDNSTALNNSLKLIDDAVSEVRSISHNMMPNALISIGFEAALKEQVHLINDAGKVHVKLLLPEESLDLEESKAISLYRIIQEILNNALKYSLAENIIVDIIHNHHSGLSITIKDNGEGFDTKLIDSSTGIGWGNIISRAELLNGELNIHSTIGEGSEVSLKLAV